MNLISIINNIKIGNYNISDWVRENDHNGYRLLTLINGDGWYKTRNKISIGFYREDASLYLFEFYKTDNDFYRLFYKLYGNDKSAVSPDDAMSIVDNFLFKMHKLAVFL